jgi:hypothetical protein
MVDLSRFPSAERIIFTPRSEGRVYEFSGPGSFGRLLVGDKCDGDPGGIRTRDLDLERVASLARLDDGV